MSMNEVFKRWIRDISFLVAPRTPPKKRRAYGGGGRQHLARHTEKCQHCGQPMQVGEGQIQYYHGPNAGNCRQAHRHPTLNNSFC